MFDIDSNIIADAVEKFFGIAKSIFFQIVALPVKLWMAIPEWVKTTFLIFLFILSIYIAYWCYKNKDSWKKVYIH